ncbi:hypothetical protein ABZ543_08315 [Streptomyces roseifaciens]
MPDSPEGTANPEEPRTLVSIPEMPALLKEAGLKPVGAPRIRQLVNNDDDFPDPAYDRGRVRLWNRPEVLEYFGGRKLRQGERTDLKKDQAAEDTKSA